MARFLKKQSSDLVQVEQSQAAAGYVEETSLLERVYRA